MNKPLTFLLALTFLFLFSCSVYGDDLQDGRDAYKRKDYATAYKLLAPLAEQGDAGAQSNLGTMYGDGKGVPQDYKEAVKWYRLSAEQGEGSAQDMLGYMYQDGDGVPQDNKEAVKWFRLSAEQGREGGQFKLGWMYSQGRGVPQDYALAHMWYNLSASNGNKDAVKNRNIIENIMTKQQVENAQEMARNWKPTTK